MGNKSLVNIIELLSIVIGATFGLLGSLTETKNKKGHLTIWGVIAVLGILVTNSFSFVESFLKQQEQREKDLKDSLQDLNNLKIQNGKFKKEIKFQQTIIAKTDSSLVKQNLLQTETGRLLKQLDSSMGIQNNIQSASNAINNKVSTNLKEQELLGLKANSILSQTLVANNNINRSLNPLLPFAVSYKIKVSIKKRISIEGMDNQVDNDLITAEKKLLKVINTYHGKVGDLFGKTGLSKLRDSVYSVSPRYKYFSDFKFLQDLSVFITLTGKDEENSLRSLYAEAKPSFNKGKYDDLDVTDAIRRQSFYGIDIFYLPKLAEFEISVFTESVVIHQDFGIIKSSIDLPGATIYLRIDDPALNTTFESFSLYLPPSYSKKFGININKGEISYNNTGLKLFSETIIP